MISPIPLDVLAATSLREHCTAPGCVNGFVRVDAEYVRCCAECHGTTRARRGMFDPRSGIDAPESPETLHAAQYTADGGFVIPWGEPRTVGVVVPIERWRRMVALARQLTGPENSGPAAELYALIGGDHG